MGLSGTRDELSMRSRAVTRGRVWFSGVLQRQPPLFLVALLRLHQSGDGIFHDVRLPHPFRWRGAAKSFFPDPGDLLRQKVDDSADLVWAFSSVLTAC